MYTRTRFTTATAQSTATRRIARGMNEYAGDAKEMKVIMKDAGIYNEMVGWMLRIRVMCVGESIGM